jgi:histidine triad (HIT) family protein
MLMEDCIFCRIVEGRVPSWKVYEDANYLAILDTIPAVEGQTIILSKGHRHSYAMLLEDHELTEMVLVAKRVARQLEKSLGVERVQLIFAGTSVAHLHAKLYPTTRRITVEGKKATEDELKRVHDRILNKT